MWRTWSCCWPHSHGFQLLLFACADLLISKSSLTWHPWGNRERKLTFFLLERSFSITKIALERNFYLNITLFHWRKTCRRQVVNWVMVIGSNQKLLTRLTASFTDWSWVGLSICIIRERHSPKEIKCVKVKVSIGRGAQCVKTDEHEGPVTVCSFNTIRVVLFETLIALFKWEMLQTWKSKKDDSDSKGQQRCQVNTHSQRKGGNIALLSIWHVFFTHC